MPVAKMVADGDKEKHWEGKVVIVSKDLFVLELLLWWCRKMVI